MQRRRLDRRARRDSRRSSAVGQSLRWTTSGRQPPSAARGDLGHREAEAGESHVVVGDAPVRARRRRARRRAHKARRTARHRRRARRRACRLASVQGGRPAQAGKRLDERQRRRLGEHAAIARQDDALTSQAGFSARGSEAETAARPPVCTKSAISEVANRIFGRARVQRQRPRAAGRVGGAVCDRRGRRRRRAPRKRGIARPSSFASARLDACPCLSRQG